MNAESSAARIAVRESRSLRFRKPAIPACSSEKARILAWPDRFSFNAPSTRNSSSLQAALAFVMRAAGMRGARMTQGQRIKPVSPARQSNHSINAGAQEGFNQGKDAPGDRQSHRALDGGEIGGEAFEKLSSAGMRVERHGDPLQALEHTLPHSAERLALHPRGEKIADQAGGDSKHGSDRQNDGHPVKRLAVPWNQGAVDEEPHGEWETAR